MVVPVYPKLNPISTHPNVHLENDNVTPPPLIQKGTLACPEGKDAMTPKQYPKPKL